MNEQEVAKLRGCIKDVIGKVRKYQDRSLGEQNTKASLIEPIIESLVWDVRDPDDVFREYKPTSKDSPVDYALTILRKPRLFVEAKGLGETLSDRKWVSQVLGYAIVAGVEWCMLTDGDEYRFYNATAPLDADEKLFCSVRLSTDDAGEVARTLSLISRRNMEENILDVLWSAHYVDRRVKQSLQDMFSTPDGGLIRLIRQREAKLTPKDIQESLRRLDLRIESVTPLPEPVKRAPKSNGEGTPPKRPKPARKDKKKAHFGVTLTQLIQAHYLKPPLWLFRKYKGTVLEATLHPDGTVDFQGTRYDSCSTAAELARGSITGRRMNTNGWQFWQFREGQGKPQELIAVRGRFMREKGQE
jgi:hypothetical protein